MMDLHYMIKLREYSKNRFINGNRRRYRKRSTFDWNDCLSDNSVNYNDDEFLYHFRMSRASFRVICEIIKNHLNFSYKTRKKRPVEHQLLVFLYRVGKRGSGGSSKNVSQFFGVGYGTVNLYVKRITEALNDLKDVFIQWPTNDEKNNMKARMAAEGWPDCIGIIDGTHIGLEWKPTKYHECYFNRKSFYSINITVICDDRGRILYFYAGWPGTTHDNRVFKNSKVYKEWRSYFNRNEHLIGDSAYSSCRIMVQTFKKHKGSSSLSYEKEFFNTKIAKVRIKSKHCIGILKGRFPSMKQINVWIHKGNPEVKQIVGLVTACSVLHNILLQCNDQIPQEWYDQLAKEIDWDINNSDCSSDEEFEDPMNHLPSYQDHELLDIDMREKHYKRIVNNYI